MCEGPEEAGSGVGLRLLQQALSQQQEEPSSQPSGTPAPEGSHHSSAGLEALPETWAAAVAGEGAGQSKG